MDVSQYYITTLTNAFTKLAPLFIFVVGGYFVFIKLPFLFLRKSLDDQKKKMNEGDKEVAVKIEDKRAEAPKLKVLGEMPKKKPEAKAEQKAEKKTEDRKTEFKKPSPPKEKSPLEVLGFRPNEVVSPSALKARYFELLKQNHPDRVASMGEDFKKLAEKNTKEINQAYEKLKTKAA